MDEQFIYNIVLLKIISDSTHNNDYRLERFYAKTENPSQVFESLRELRKEDLIDVTDSKAQVKTYFLKKKGEELLRDNYDFDKVKLFVNKIENTGFFVQILEIINSNRNGNQS